MKSDCPHITAAAPISPCKIKKKTERNERNLTSLMCPITFQAITANKTIVIPITDETNLWLSSITNSDDILEGISWPGQSGQPSPHPAPESVFVTKSPPSNIKSIPKLDTIPKDFNVLIIYFPHFNKILYKIFMPI